MTNMQSKKVMQYKKKLNNSQITWATRIRVAYLEPTLKTASIKAN